MKRFVACAEDEAMTAFDELRREPTDILVSFREQCAVAPLRGTPGDVDA
jgi:hypothetical protein